MTEHSTNSAHWILGTRLLAWVCFLLIVTRGLGVAGQELPPESELPPREAASTLPDESQLPPASDDSGGPDLPDEAALPPDGDDRAGRPKANPLPAQIRPLLRLNYEGHAGVIRALDLSEDGNTMVTGGEDKDLHIWQRSVRQPSGWRHLRTIRWPIARGPRGRIYQATLRGTEVAFAGHGAFGLAGEIRVVDAISGELVQTLVDQHRQVIAGLAWSPGDTPSLVSADSEGQMTQWSRNPNSGLWAAQMLVANDVQTYGRAVAAALRSRRTFLPVMFRGDNECIAPVFVGVVANPQGEAKWHLARRNLQTGATTVLDTADHIKHVVDLDATASGDALVSCDWSGSVWVWKFDGEQAGAPVTFRPDAPPVFVELSPDGQVLLIGTEWVSGRAGAPRARLQLWDLSVAPPRLISERAIAENALCGSLDVAHRQALVAQGSRVECYSFDADYRFEETPPATLTIPARPILRVACSKAPDSYRVAIGTQTDGNGKVKLEHLFDLGESKLLGREEIDEEDFLRSQRTDTRWSVRLASDRQRYQLFEAESERGVLPFRYDKHGVPSAICTLAETPTGTEEAGEKPRTAAIAVGTSGRNDIYVYAASRANPPTLLRHFRGHAGAVRSLSTSQDGAYLVSGSDDSTIAVWNLQDLFSASRMANRWGAEFEQIGETLIVAEVREDGPLYFRGVRGGDQLLSIRWTEDDGQAQAVSDPAAVMERLLDLPFDALVTFEFSRLGRAQPTLQSYAAWRPLASVLVDETREWAFWTPAGYYDASFNGHQRFGWQINQGIDRQPDFFRAAQFRRQLEKPAVMRQLLRRGSLPAATRRTLSRNPASGTLPIANQYLNKPRIEILGLEHGATIEGDVLPVRAEISTPLGATLAPPRGFVNGVPAVSVTRLPQADGAENVAQFEWRFRLPADSELQLELVAATEAKVVDRVRMNLRHIAKAAPRKPRLHVLAVGASQYPDAQIQSLDFAAGAARKVSRLFQRRSAPLYDVTSEELVDEQATRPMWRELATAAVDQMADSVSPDDLVVMYLCGHGLRDRQTNQWYFVTANARYHDLMNDEYSDCLAFEDLALLARLPCRKLAILDSCHSGAVQPLMDRDDLKSALRFLQDDLVLTLTASEGDEEAAEQRETRLGRFTSKLASALEGDADENGDGRVTLQETVQYVRATVAEESEREGLPQHPTASPQYLIEAFELPLTADGAPRTANN